MVLLARPGNLNRWNRLLNRQGTIWNGNQNPTVRIMFQIFETRWNQNGTSLTRTVAITIPMFMLYGILIYDFVIYLGFLPPFS